MKFNQLIPAALAVALGAQGSPTPHAETKAIEARQDLSSLMGFGMDLGNACSCLQIFLPNRIFAPGSQGYDTENSLYWSATGYSNPACIFVPRSAAEVSMFVLAARLLNVKFAVRGGGHMPIPLYNNAASNGVLVSTTELNTLNISSDKNTLSVGPGRRWRDVADYLAPYGKAAVGGRVGKVGVPGLILGGGISFYSSQYGWASDNVVKFQCVLANGLLIEATATNSYSDLFWALKGGANSFCIVTRFDIKVYNSAKVWVGVAQYNPADSAQYINAVSTFGQYGGQDSKAAIIPTIVVQPGAGLTLYGASKFYDAATVPASVFQNFSAPTLTPLVDMFAYQTLSDYLAQMDPLQPDGLRQDFRTLSFVVNKDAVQYVHDTFTSKVNQLAAVSGVGASLTFQPISKEFVQQSIDKGGNPQGLDVNNAPFFIVVMNWNWANAADDATVSAFATSITNELDAGLKSRGVSVGFLYLNDAGKDQKVFQSYPAANLARLKTIRTKYDPTGVYTDLLSGGWKVSAA